MSTPVAILCTHPQSHYRHLSGAICFDEHTDARTFAGGMPVVAHPPCRLWGKLRGLSTLTGPEAERERELARFCVNQVRQCGGVLEHPAFSKLWADEAIPLPGTGLDHWGGFSIDVNQCWWGHRAIKRTWLYIVGTTPATMPEYGPSFVAHSGICGTLKRRRIKGLPEIPKKERHLTPPAFATWLVELARHCTTHNPRP